MAKKNIDTNTLSTAIASALERFFASETTETKRPYLGQPSSEHLLLINGYLKKETTAEDWFVCLVRASDNIVNRSKEKWSLKILERMSLFSNGISFLLNHDWYDVESSVGFVFDSFLSKEEPPSKQTVGSEEDNRRIIEKEGYVAFYCWVAIPTNKEIINYIESRSTNNVSTGGYVENTRVLCPICTEEKGRDIGVFDVSEDGKYICPHSLPGWGWWDDSEEMPYAIWDGDYDPIEVSFVNAGNLPAAEIIRA